MGNSLIVMGLIMMFGGSFGSIFLNKNAKFLRCTAVCTGAVVVMCGLANNAVTAEAVHESGTSQTIQFVVFALIAAAAGMRARHHYKYPNGKVAKQKRSSATIPRSAPSAQPQGEILDDHNSRGLTMDEEWQLKEIEMHLING